MKIIQVTRFVFPNNMIELAGKTYMTNKDWMEKECIQRRKHGQQIWIETNDEHKIAIFRKE